MPKNQFLAKRQLREHRLFSLFACFAYAWIVHTWRNQLVLELLLKLSDTLHKQYRYNEHVHKGVSCQNITF